MQIQPMFALPFALIQHPDPARMNAALRELFLAREAEGTRHANPHRYTDRNDQIFESRFDLFAWPEPEITELRDFCLSQLSQVVAQLNGYDQITMKSLGVKTDAWFHVTRRNGYFGVHNHPLASWSCVYCVAPGHSDASEPDSGKLTFITPHHMSGMYRDAGTAFLKHPFGIQNFSLLLEAGQLVLFPSSVLHHVMPFFGEDERITVAFNCAFRQRAP